ncbi:MAG: hypothetical protein QMD94_05615 [Candidatus Omnitrophota bacterium]|nr:hypothetical protein [Candidatus Omnitrophota bacterium]
MFLILIFTIIGFLGGLSYVLIKRRLRPNKLLVAAFLGLLSLGLWKIFREYYKKSKW